MLQQQTIREPVSFAGIGLHSGNRVNMRFLPAPANTGIRFRRVDLEGQPEFDAVVDHVGDTTRSTTLAKGSIRIHTVEHVLGNFAGLGVDNAIVELDANEPPIGDGSAREYLRMVDQAGLQPQDAAREPFVVSEPMEFTAGETTMAVFPHDRLKVTYQRRSPGPLHPVPQSGGDAGVLAHRVGPCPDVLLLRGDRGAHPRRPDQGRQSRKRRGDPRRRRADHRTVALRGRVRAAQDPRHCRRPLAVGTTSGGAHRRRASQSRRHQLRTGPPPAGAAPQADGRRPGLHPPPPPRPTPRWRPRSPARWSAR
ncbi:MAG: UDP-3-O-acyl-N-acetylglucosamine deacetylase [Verrucomicrobiales bacterium]|nr:UDP-3-O-acyl-N-acetylglucosamine deacetylase [Verrucomicrobiales bacterium]